MKGTNEFQLALCARNKLGWSPYLSSPLILKPQKNSETHRPPADISEFPNDYRQGSICLFGC